MIFNMSGSLRRPRYTLQHSSITVILLPGMTELTGRLFGSNLSRDTGYPD
jgi:hypothetical protein